MSIQSTIYFQYFLEITGILKATKKSRRTKQPRQELDIKNSTMEEQILVNFTFGIFGILFLILLWLTLDYHLGRRMHLKALYLPHAPKRQSQIEIFTDGEFLFKDYFDELKRATKHIHILFYIARSDSFSQEFFDIITKKAAEGVEVRLMLDWVGSFKVDRKLVQKLKDAGGQFTFSQVPKFPFFFYTSQIRNHRKVTVIDGKMGYLGGFNIGKEYVNQDPKFKQWRDYHLKIKGEGVLDLQKELLTNWRKNTKIDLLQNAIYFPEQQAGPIEHEIIPAEANMLEKTFLGLISSAKETIMIGTPYFIPSPKVFHALLAAIKRGVAIKILVPKITDHILVQEASYPYFRTLLKEKAQVFQFHNGFYHAKTLMIDDQICDIGTANFDKRSFFLNLEINCFLYDKRMIQLAKETMERDFKDAKPLTLSELNQPNLWRSTKEKLASIFSHFL
jgi:cardiolipin synthase A/B